MFVYNRVQLAGEIASDIKCINMDRSGEIPTVTFILHLFHYMRNRQDEVKAYPDNVIIRAHGRQAYMLRKWAKRKTRIFVDGALRCEYYKRPNGEQDIRLVVVMANMWFTDKDPKRAACVRNSPEKYAEASAMLTMPHSPSESLSFTNGEMPDTNVPYTPVFSEDFYYDR